MKVSFDFDMTLSRKEIQEFAKELVDSGYDVYIVTLRDKNPIGYNNYDLFDIAKKCGIDKNNIIFMCMADKIEYLYGNDFLFHLDVDLDQLELITYSFDSCVPVDSFDKNWKEKCKNVLNK